MTESIETPKMPSENFILCINVLRAQNKDSSNQTFIFSCYIVAFGKIVVTLHSGFGGWVLGAG